ncbi:MAG: hypothetical protein ACR2ME_00390 [Acidimicrobiia bacterium]
MAIERTMDCISYPNSLLDVAELFPGGSAEANVCLTVPAGELPGLLLIVDHQTDFDAERKFFELGL